MTNSQRIAFYRPRPRVGEIFGWATLFFAAVVLPALILVEAL